MVEVNCCIAKIVFEAPYYVTVYEYMSYYEHNKNFKHLDISICTNKIYAHNFTSIAEAKRFFKKHKEVIELLGFTEILVHQQTIKLI